MFKQSKPYGSNITVESPTFQVFVTGGNDPKATAEEVDKALRNKFSKYFDKEMVKIGIQMGYTPITQS